MVTRHSLLLTRPRHAEWVAEELPAPREHELLVETCCGAISVGAELPQYRGDKLATDEIVYPRMTGYESLGVVVARGQAVTDIAVGQRVIAFYGHRTHAVVDATKVIPVPDGLDERLALLAILSCDAAKGVLKLHAQPQHSAIITGSGTMGLLALHFLRRNIGATEVAVMEPLAERRRLAERIGATAVLTAPAQVVEGSYDIGVECSGRDGAFALLQSAVKPGGSIVVLSDGNVERLTLTAAFHRKELRIVASSDGYDYQEHAKWYFADVLVDSCHLEEMFQVEVQVQRLATVLQDMAAARSAPVKVLVRY